MRNGGVVLTNAALVRQNLGLQLRTHYAQVPTFRRLSSGKWRAEIYIKGYPRQSRSFHTKPAANRWAKETEDSLRGGGVYRSTVLLSDIFSLYLNEIVPLKKTTRFHAQNINTLNKAMGHFLVSELLPADVVDYVSMRRKTVSSSTVLKEINTLNHVLKTGVGLWGVMSANPVPTAKDILSATKAISISKSRNRRLQDGEEERLLAELPTESRLIALLTLHTARRLKEILAIQKGLVTVREGRYYLRVLDTKTDHPITVPLSDKAADLLKDFEAFTVTSNAVSQAFYRAAKRAGISDLRLTDLRHEALSRFFEMGLSVPEVMAISGHRTANILLGVYSQVQGDKVSEKLKRP